MKKNIIKAEPSDIWVSPKNEVNNGDQYSNEIIKYFKILDENDEPIFQAFDMFPIPIEVFAPDGTTVFLNRALMELNGIKDASLGIGKYNLLKDKMIMDQPDCREVILRAFKGEKAICWGFPAPIQDLVDRKLIKEKPFERAFMDMYFYPVMKDKVLIFIVNVHVVRNLYFGRPDVVKAKEYIDTHWQEDFVPEVFAKAVNMSATPLYKLFKEYIGMTPGDYHKKVKIEHLKEKLADKNLSIKEAFDECGVDSQGWFAKKVFKEETGMTPKQYKDNLEK